MLWESFGCIGYGKSTYLKEQDLTNWNERYEEILEINNVEVKNNEEKFVFYLESWGQLTCKEILLKTLEIFNDKLDEFESKLKKAK